jgi:hypothetical protein
MILPVIRCSNFGVLGASAATAESAIPLYLGVKFSDDRHVLQMPCLWTRDGLRHNRMSPIPIRFLGDAFVESSDAAGCAERVSLRMNRLRLDSPLLFSTWVSKMSQPGTSVSPTNRISHLRHAEAVLS